ncbi:MAG: OmpH family outer membrane protein [Acidobacteriota bacterium]
MFHRSSRVLVLPLALILGLVVVALPAQAQGQKIGVINVQKVIAESTAGKAAQTQIEAIQQQKAQQLEALGKEAQDLQKRVEEGRLSLSPDKLEELREQYEDKVIALRRAQDDAGRDVQTTGERLMGELEGEIMPVIEAVGQEGGYSVIFNKFESGLVYASDTIDITDQVIARLNAAGGSE